MTNGLTSLLVGILCLPFCLSGSPNTTSDLTVEVRHDSLTNTPQNWQFCVFLLLSLHPGSPPIAAELINSKTQRASFKDLHSTAVFPIAALVDPSRCLPKTSEPAGGTVFAFYGFPGKPKPVNLPAGALTKIAIYVDGSHRIDSGRPERLMSLHDPVSPGVPATVYTPGYQRRAQQVQSIVGDELSFYKAEFGTPLIPITLAVLDAKQWAKISDGQPYGLPNIDRFVFMMPADWKDTHFIPFPTQPLDDPLVEQALKTGKPWTDLLEEGADGIGTHEVGHSLVAQLRIYPPSHWFEEFVASYLGYAYLAAARPQEVLANKIFWRVGLTGEHPKTSLTYWDTNEQKLSGPNLNWYQCALEQRVIDVYRRSGLNFIRRLQRAFPETGPEMSCDQILERLESFSPGWKLWARAVERGNIKPAD